MDAIYRKGWFKFATYWVAGYFLLFVLFWFAAASGLDSGLAFFAMFAIHGLTMLLAFVLFVFYVIHIAQNPFLDTGGKVLWVFVMLLCNVLAMPVYYQRHLTRT